MSSDPGQEPTIQQLFDLTGQRVLITGASGYLGGAMARGLAEAGATVVVASRDLARGEATAKALPAANRQTHLAVQLDHMDEACCRDGFARAVELAGGLDALVANGHEPNSRDWTNVSADQFTRQLSNATGYFLLARELHAHAVSQHQPATIVLIGSMYGIVGSYPEAYEGIGVASPAAYHTLKGGIIQLTRHLAVYWAQNDIRVNCLSPGPFPPPSAADELVSRLSEHSPSKRMGSPHELKGALVFLISQASSYVTGQNIVVDGGWTAW